MRTVVGGPWPLNTGVSSVNNEFDRGSDPSPAPDARPNWAHATPALDQAPG